MAEKEKPKEKKSEKEENKKKQEGYLSDLKTFAYGGVSGNALAREDYNFANVSLEKLASDMGLDTDGRLEGFLKGTFASKEGTETATNIYAGKYNSARDKSTTSNLWKFYDEYAIKYLGDLKGKAEEEIGKFNDAEYGKIKEKYLAASEILKSQTLNFSKEQKEKAKKEMEKYGKVVTTLEILNKAYLRKYENSTDEQVDINTLKKMFSEKDKEGEKEKWV